MRTPLMLLGWLLLGAAVGETPVFAVQGARARQAGLEPLDIRKEPKQADWRYFLKAPEIEREKLWAYHAGKGLNLGQWAWGWRLGWVRACDKSARPYCQDVLRQALFDDALVVRADAATRIGRLYEGSANGDVARLLAKAYRNPKNLRRGKPLFVQPRILFAMRRIGGDEALKLGETLAARHPESKGYWAKLAEIED